MKQRSPNHWTWNLFRWCTAWHRPRWWYLWFRKLKLEYLWTQLDPYGYGVMTYRNGDELVWLFPNKRKSFNCDGTDAVWYNVNLAHGYKSLKEIDAFWAEYSEACRAAALRDETAREDVYF